MRKLAIAAFAAAATVALLAPPSASALSFTDVSASPENPNAGANSNFNIHMEFGNPEDQVKDLTIHLPPGLVGNPLVTPLCTVEQLESDSCPPESQVGALSVNLTIESLLTDTVSGALYNLTPQPGEPARFGIVLQSPAEPLVPDTILQSAARLRKSDFGLDSVLTDIPNNTGPPLNADIEINSQDITLFGTAGNPPQGFIRNPTSCGTKTTAFDATSYADPATVVGASTTYDSVNCQALPFSPDFRAFIGAPGQTGPASRPPLTTVIGQTIEQAGIQRAEVLLPPGVGPDNAALANQCPVADFEASACPEHTLVGTARAESPLQSTPLTGTVSIAQPLAPGLPNLGLDLTGALPLQLRGNFVLSPAPGNAFEGLPDIPISRFELTFQQGRLVTVSRDLCTGALPMFSTSFVGHNGAQRSDQVPATVEGCSGGSGKPTATVKLRKTGSEHPRMKVNADAAFSPIGEMSVKLPKQLRLSRGKALDKGTKASADGEPIDDSALAGGAKKLKLDAGTGADKLKLKVAGHALNRVDEIDGKLPFKVKLTDLAGETTTVKTKAG